METSAHDEMRELTSLYVLGGLTPEERSTFEAHLPTCAECAAEVQSLRPVVPALAQVVQQVAPPAALRDRVLNRVKGVEEASAQRVPRPSPEPRKTTTAAAPDIAGMQWLPLAASIVIAIALGAYALQLRGRISTLETQLKDALSRADAGERQIADARRVSTEAQTQLAVLTAPDVARVDLAGQPPAPGAQGRAFWSRSRGLVFTATNLPPLPPGQTYQLWFVVGSDNEKISAGIFAPDATGVASLFVTAPPGIPPPGLLAVTLETAGGNPQPLGPIYLAGQVPS